jgi:hypothetical protein
MFTRRNLLNANSTICTLDGGPIFKSSFTNFTSQLAGERERNKIKKKQERRATEEKRE